MHVMDLIIHKHACKLEEIYLSVTFHATSIVCCMTGQEM